MKPQYKRWPSPAQTQCVLIGICPTGSQATSHLRGPDASPLLVHLPTDLNSVCQLPLPQPVHTLAGSIWIQFYKPSQEQLSS